jgi:hypothetical protein
MSQIFPLLSVLWYHYDSDFYLLEVLSWTSFIFLSGLSRLIHACFSFFILAVFTGVGRSKKFKYDFKKSELRITKFVIAPTFVREGLIPRALFLGEMRIISPVSFELRLLE